MGTQFESPPPPTDPHTRPSFTPLRASRPPPRVISRLRGELGGGVNGAHRPDDAPPGEEHPKFLKPALRNPPPRLTWDESSSKQRLCNVCVSNLPLNTVLRSKWNLVICQPGSCCHIFFYFCCCFITEIVSKSVSWSERLSSPGNPEYHFLQLL